MSIRTPMLSRFRLCVGSLFMLSLLLCQPPAQASVEAQDAEGRIIRLATPATRIVALAPHIVENLYSIGAENAIVGAVHYSDYPEPANRIPRVGGVGAISLESIVALQPELIILWGSGTPPGLRSGIERLGLPYFVDEIRSLDDLGKSFTALGALTGHSVESKQVASQLETSLKDLSVNPVNRDDADVQTVFLQLWDQPLQSIGKEHLLNEVIERCGGKSITRNALGLAPLVSLERVLTDDPALIIVESRAQALHWKNYPDLQATKTGSIAVIHPDLLHRPTLRLLEGMQLICAGVNASRMASQQSAPDS